MTDKVRVAVLGAGSWAVSNHMPLLAARDDVELVSACTIGETKLRRLQELFGVEVVSEDYREALDVEPDAVVVSSPAGFHYEHTKAALQQGAHVLCEKPFTISSDTAWELVDLVEQTGRHLLIPYGWNYSRMAIEAKRLIEDIGQIEMMTVHFAAPLRALLMEGKTYSGSWRRGGTEVRVHPDFQMEPETWRNLEQSGGGFGHANVTHALGLALWLSGRRAEEVYARMSMLGGEGLDLHDAISVRYDGGAIGTVSGASTPEGAERHQLDIRVFGSEGQLMVDMERERVWMFRGPGDEVVLDTGPDEGVYDCGAPANVLIDLIQGKDVDNNSPAELGARVVELLETAYASAQSGTPEPAPMHAR